MFENRRMRLLRYLLIVAFIFLFFCKERASSYKPENEKSTSKVGNYDKVFNLSRDSIFIEKNDLIIRKESKEKIYENLIVNVSALFTSLEVKDENSFYLIYEYTASSTKMQHIYYISIKNMKLYLVWKEVLKLNNGKFGSYKINYGNLIIPNKEGFDYMEVLGENIEVSFTSSSEKAMTIIYDKNEKKIKTLMSDFSGIKRFMNPLISIKQTEVQN